MPDRSNSRFHTGNMVSEHNMGAFPYSRNANMGPNMDARRPDPNIGPTSSQYELSQAGSEILTHLVKKVEDLKNMPSGPDRNATLDDVQKELVYYAQKNEELKNYINMNQDDRYDRNTFGYQGPSDQQPRKHEQPKVNWYCERTNPSPFYQLVVTRDNDPSHFTQSIDDILTFFSKYVDLERYNYEFPDEHRYFWDYHYEEQPVQATGEVPTIPIAYYPYGEKIARQIIGKVAEERKENISDILSTATNTFYIVRPIKEDEELIMPTIMTMLMSQVFSNSYVQHITGYCLNTEGYYIVRLQVREMITTWMAVNEICIPPDCSLTPLLSDMFKNFVKAVSDRIAGFSMTMSWNMGASSDIHLGPFVNGDHLDHAHLWLNCNHQDVTLDHAIYTMVNEVFREGVRAKKKNDILSIKRIYKGAMKKRELGNIRKFVKLYKMTTRFKTPPPREKPNLDPERFIKDDRWLQRDVVEGHKLTVKDLQRYLFKPRDKKNKFIRLPVPIHTKYHGKFGKPAINYLPVSAAVATGFSTLSKSHNRHFEYARPRPIKDVAALLKDPHASLAYSIEFWDNFRMIHEDYLCRRPGHFRMQPRQDPRQYPVPAKKSAQTLAIRDSETEDAGTTEDDSHDGELEKSPTPEQPMAVAPDRNQQRRNQNMVGLNKQQQWTAHHQARVPYTDDNIAHNTMHPNRQMHSGRQYQQRMMNYYPTRSYARSRPQARSQPPRDLQNPMSKPPPANAAPPAEAATSPEPPPIVYDSAQEWPELTNRRSRSRSTSKQAVEKPVARDSALSKEEEDFDDDVEIVVEGNEPDSDSTRGASASVKALPPDTPKRKLPSLEDITKKKANKSRRDTSVQPRTTNEARPSLEPPSGNLTLPVADTRQGQDSSEYLNIDSSNQRENIEIDVSSSEAPTDRQSGGADIPTEVVDKDSQVEPLSSENYYSGKKKKISKKGIRTPSYASEDNVTNTIREDDNDNEREKNVEEPNQNQQQVVVEAPPLPPRSKPPSASNRVYLRQKDTSKQLPPPFRMGLTMKSSKEHALADRLESEQITEAGVGSTASEENEGDILFSGDESDGAEILEEQTGDEDNTVFEEDSSQQDAANMASVNNNQIEIVEEPSLIHMDVRFDPPENMHATPDNRFRRKDNPWQDAILIPQKPVEKVVLQLPEVEKMPADYKQLKRDYKCFRHCPDSIAKTILDKSTLAELKANEREYEREQQKENAAKSDPIMWNQLSDAIPNAQLTDKDEKGHYINNVPPPFPVNLNHHRRGNKAAPVATVSPAVQPAKPIPGNNPVVSTAPLPRPATTTASTARPSTQTATSASSKPKIPGNTNNTSTGNQPSQKPRANNAASSANAASNKNTSGSGTVTEKKKPHQYRSKDDKRTDKQIDKDANISDYDSGEYDSDENYVDWKVVINKKKNARLQAVEPRPRQQQQPEPIDFETIVAEHVETTGDWGSIDLPDNIQQDISGNIAEFAEYVANNGHPYEEDYEDPEGYVIHPVTREKFIPDWRIKTQDRGFSTTGSTVIDPVTGLIKFQYDRRFGDRPPGSIKFGEIRPIPRSHVRFTGDPKHYDPYATARIKYELSKTEYPLPRGLVIILKKKGQEFNPISRKNNTTQNNQRNYSGNNQVNYSESSYQNNNTHQNYNKMMDRNNTRQDRSRSRKEHTLGMYLPEMQEK